METHQLLLHANALLEVGNEVGTLALAALQAIGLEALHHLHLEFAAFVVGLMVDQAASQIRQGQAQKGSQRHFV